jgi:hypothetical protein
MGHRPAELVRLHYGEALAAPIPLERVSARNWRRVEGLWRVLLGKGEGGRGS